MTDQMKAIVLRQYGGPQVLQLEYIPKPVPKKNEILIRMYATSVTAEDPRMRAFNHPALLKLPVGLIFGFRKPRNPVLGIECSGIIESVGTDVRNFKTGDEVFGYTGLGFGAYAAYKCVSEKSLICLKPGNLTFTEAACLVNGPLSALVFLKKKGKIKSGNKILIYGASGSVGTAAVQLAKYFGAEVTGVCSAKNAELVMSIGADRVIDYTSQNFMELHETYDLIFDTVGKTNMKKCIDILAPDGKYLRTDFGLSHVFQAIYTSLFSRKKVIVASSNFYWKKADLIFLQSLAEKGHLRPVLDQVFPLEQMADAHIYVESGHKIGNVGITIR